MIDMFVTFCVITLTANTKENRVRMKHIIENTSTKPPTAWMLASACKQKPKLRESRAMLLCNYNDRDAFWNKLIERAYESMSLENKKDSFNSQ